MGEGPKGRMRRESLLSEELLHQQEVLSLQIPFRKVLVSAEEEKSEEPMVGGCERTVKEAGEEDRDLDVNDSIHVSSVMPKEPG